MVMRRVGGSAAFQTTIRISGGRRENWVKEVSAVI